MAKLNAGFFTAMGTPLDADGNIVEASLRREIEMQIGDKYHENDYRWKTYRQCQRRHL